MRCMLFPTPRDFQDKMQVRIACFSPVCASHMAPRAPRSDRMADQHDVMINNRGYVRAVRTPTLSMARSSVRDDWNVPASVRNSRICANFPPPPPPDTVHVCISVASSEHHPHPHRPYILLLQQRLIKKPIMEPPSAVCRTRFLASC